MTEKDYIQSMVDGLLVEKRMWETANKERVKEKGDNSIKGIISE